MTYQTEINSLIARKGYKIPFVNSYFASSLSLSRISNGQGRPRKAWTKANSKFTDQVKLRTLSWCGWLLGWHIDHIVPVSKGGSYHISNLRLLPPFLNHVIGASGDWSHEKINKFVEHLGPEWRKELGIPEGFQSCSAAEFFKSIDLERVQVTEGG